MRNLLLLLSAFLVISTTCFAQQDPHFTMYNFNRQALNPAYAGALEATNITLLARTQWLGIQGAPNSGTLSASGFIKPIWSGIGGTIMVDKLGPLTSIGGVVQYAFHAPLSPRAKLNIGIEGGVYSKSLVATWIYDEAMGVDPTIGPANTEYSNNGVVPDLGAGLYFHLKRRTLLGTSYPQDAVYAGLSVSHLLEPNLDGLLDNPTGQSRLRRGIDFTVGGTIPVSRKVLIQPSAFFRTDLASYQMDLTAHVYVSPMVFGLNFRGNIYSNNPLNNKKVFWNNDSVNGIVGFNANTNLFIGYAYDFSISSLRPQTSGSHELMVSYTFPTLTRTIAPILDTRGAPE